MGLAFTKLFARLFSKKEMRILMVRMPLLPCRRILQVPLGLGGLTGPRLCVGGS